MSGWEQGLAATKTRPPLPPASLIRRSRLYDQLSHDVRFALVCAPAGSGKSTLLASWLSDRGQPAAWLQVEQADSDPTRFWSFLTQAIGQAVPLPPDLAAIVISSHGDETTVVSALVNALSDLPGRLIIVIDDYHLIANDTVHRGVERLIELCPANVQIVLASRIDPPFRLGRLRVRGQLVEVRGADLRFARHEAPALLGAAGGVLDDDLVGLLCDRTEGWAAGLVLAGLSLRSSTDPAGFVEAFSGDDHLVVEYLRDELLGSLDPADRLRLLETSILEQLSGPLVDAVTDSTGGAAWLRETAAANQLLIGLGPNWFRYHHLLRDLLRFEVDESLAGRLVELHARAAQWFEAQGDLGSAIRHRLASGDRAAAATLLLVEGQRLLQTGQVETLRRTLDELGDLVPTLNWCALLYGWCEYLTGHYTEADAWIDTMVRVSEPGFDTAVATSLRINVSLARGDVGPALALARHVDGTGQLPKHNCDLATATGAAYAWAGQADDARRVLRYASDRGATEGFHTAHVMALVYLAVLEFTEASPTAWQAADAAIAAAAACGLAAYHGVGSAYAVRANTGKDSQQAGADAEHAVAMARRWSTDLARAFVLTAFADTSLATGHDGGTQALAEAQALVGRCPDPGVVGSYLSRTAARYGATIPAPRNPHLVEQLTERELAVLHYLPTALSQRDIAKELFVSLNTTKTHCRAIYRKLGADNRQAAVQSARNLRLL
ncbi:MAG: putative LuxR family transcriptional regulator [Frankiales bacterium]|nr:putative LuxR family transcriptional regulator [Frankiales bacterium]